MARGNLYEIEADINNIGMAGSDDFLDYAQHEFDYITITDAPEYDVAYLLNYFNALGMETGYEIHEGKSIPYVDITESGKKAYFAGSYQAFIKNAKDLSLDGFVNENTAYELRRLLEDPYEDAVTSQDNEFQSFDHFMRTASGRYYIGSVFYMH